MLRATIASCLLLVACAGGPPVPRTSPPPIGADAGTLHRGALLLARLDQPLGTQLSKPGDAWSATLTSPIVDEHGRRLVPAGARLHGHVRAVAKGYEGVPPHLLLAVDSLELDETRRRIAGQVTWLDASAGARKPPGDPVRSAGIGGLYLGAFLFGLPARASPSS
jgi:hypothetical protein